MLEPTTGTLIDALRARREKQPDEVAYTFLRDGEEPHAAMTYRELDDAARRVAAGLTAAGLAGGTVLLVFAPGLEFHRALLGCLYAGVAAAPVQVPGRELGLRRLRRIADDAGTTTVLTTAAVGHRLTELFPDAEPLRGLTLIDTEAYVAASGPQWTGSLPEPDDVALLQYTSGSTGDPKGVVVTHANFLHNIAETDELWPLGPDGVVVSWLPVFHDMGMLFGVMLPLCTGAPAYLMAPDAFIRRPARWLHAVSRFRGTHAASPSFGYDLCLRDVTDTALSMMDLSSWRMAGNGAEPVRWATVEAFTRRFAAAGFAPEAMCPGYGLAENTLKATGSAPDRPPLIVWADSAALRAGRVEAGPAHAAGTQPLVGSGHAVGGTEVRIVDPGTGVAQAPDGIGEVWISGPCVAGGYHNRPAESRETFAARITGDPAGTAYLRTGDLGFLHGGELFVAGRLKDVIIRNGRNFYPQDIELLAESADPGLHPHCAAAFSVDDGDAEHLIIVVEVDGRVLRAARPEDLRTRVRAAVHDGLRLQARHVALVRRGSVPRTSSGKVQRGACRRLYLDGELIEVPAGGA